jgi:hypothetical protein
MLRILVVMMMTTLMTGSAPALIEPKSGVEYADTLVVETPRGPATLVVTGAGLREKSFLKADVYTIASYVEAGADLAPQPAVAICALDAPKRLQMDMRRNVGRDRMQSSLTTAIVANVEDRTQIDDDLATFFSFFPDDARKSDTVVFDYVPGIGLTTSLNGEVKGVIEDFAFVTALWSVWFGREPEDDHLVRALVSQVAGSEKASNHDDSR